MALRAAVPTSSKPDNSFAHEQSTVDLLNFMERAANTIKMALDASSRPRRNTNQKRSLQGQINNLETSTTQRKLKSTHHAKINRRRLCKLSGQTMPLKSELVLKNSQRLAPHQNNAKISGVKALEERCVDLQTASRTESVLRIQDTNRSSTNTNVYVVEESRSPNHFSPSLSRDRNHFLSDSQQPYNCLPRDTIESILDQPDLSAILRNDSWDNVHENRPYSGAGDLDKYQFNSYWSDPNDCQKNVLDSTTIRSNSSEGYQRCTYTQNTKTSERYRHGSYTPIPESSEKYRHGSYTPIPESSEKYRHGSYTPIPESSEKYRHGSYTTIPESSEKYRHGSYTPTTDTSSLGTCSPQSCSDSGDSLMLTSPLPDSLMLTSPLPDSLMLTSPLPDSLVLTSPLPDSLVLTSPLPALSSCLDYQCGQSSAGSELNRITPGPEHSPCRLVYADQMSPSFHESSNMELNTNVFLQDSPSYVLSRQRNELYSPHQMMSNPDYTSCAYHPLLQLHHPGSTYSLPNIDSPKSLQHPHEEHPSYRNEDSYRSPHFPNFLFVNSSSVDQSFLFSS